MPIAQLEAVRKHVVVVIRVVVAHGRVPAGAAAARTAGPVTDTGHDRREPTRRELGELAGKDAQPEARGPLPAVGHLQQPRHRGRDTHHELALRRTGRLRKCGATVARAENQCVLAALRLEVTAGDRERSAHGHAHRLDAGDLRGRGLAALLRASGGRHHEESRGDQRQRGDDDASHCCPIDFPYRYLNSEWFHWPPRRRPRQPEARSGGWGPERRAPWSRRPWHRWHPGQP